MERKTDNLVIMHFSIRFGKGRGKIFLLYIITLHHAWSLNCRSNAFDVGLYIMCHASCIWKNMGRGSHKCQKLLQKNWKNEWPPTHAYCEIRYVDHLWPRFSIGNRDFDPSGRMMNICNNELKIIGNVVHPLCHTIHILNHVLIFTMKCWDSVEK